MVLEQTSFCPSCLAFTYPGLLKRYFRIIKCSTTCKPTPNFDYGDNLVMGARNEFSAYAMVKEQVTQYCDPSTVPCNLWVTTSHTRGMVNLSWSYTGPAYRGRSRLCLVVERSTNRRTWSTVYTCRKPASSSSTSYYCSDTGLRSRLTYYYRVCATNSSGCTNTNSSPTRRV
jgi:hypothetical protein